MTTLIMETKTTRYYWYKKEDRVIEGVRYAKIRVYRLNGRWKRTKDSWYRIDRKTKFVEYTRSVYYRGSNRTEYYAGEISVTIEIPAEDDPDFYWDEAHKKMDDLMEQEPDYGHHWDNLAVTEKTGTRYVQTMLDGTLIKKATYGERSGAEWRKLKYTR